MEAVVFCCFFVVVVLLLLFFFFGGGAPEIVLKISIRGITKKKAHEYQALMHDHWNASLLPNHTDDQSP